MPAVQAIIQHGTIPSSSMEDETGLLVQSCTYASNRESVEYKGANRCVKALEEANPILTITISAFISSYSGMTILDAGQEITSLANFSGSVLGHSPGDGVMVLKDPTISKGIDSIDKFDCSVKQYPFVV